MVDAAATKKAPSNQDAKKRSAKMLEAKSRRVGADEGWEPARIGNSCYHLNK
jgi:hypothetical protein